MRSQAGMRCIAIAGLLVASIGVSASAQTVAPVAGEEREITKRYERSERGGRSSSSSSGGDALLERVIRVRDDGLELEYDLPRSATAQDRARSWQFPVRVFKPSNGPADLLNGAELGARLDLWLEAAKLDRTACGRWIFTWNAFQIDCNPRSAIQTIEAYDLRSIVARDGAEHRDPYAARPGTLKRTESHPTGETYTAEMEVDPDSVRRTRAEMDVAAAEIMRRTLTLDAALRERAKETVSGTIALTVETDATGAVRSRTKVTRLETRGPGEAPAISTVTETVAVRAAANPHP